MHIVRKAAEMKISHVLIVGNFDYRHVNWDTCETTEGAVQPIGMFLNCINDCFFISMFLSQHVLKRDKSHQY